MAYNSFPYTNFHELNLDYLLNKSKEIEGNVQETADNVLRATQQADRSTQQAVNSQNSATASAQSAAASSQSAVNSANSAAASAQSAVEARAAAGDPKTFTAATQLTDTTKIYVYVGETGTYTYGHYYYYQGGTWHDGGVYGTWATDDALSDTSTNAVQNKVVTGAVNSLKSDISDLGLANFRIQSFFPSTAVIQKGITINNAGDFITNAKRCCFVTTWKYSDTNISMLALTNTTYKMIVFIYATSQSTSFIRKLTDDYTDLPQILPTDGSYFRITFTRTDNADMTDDDVTAIQNALIRWEYTDKSLSLENIPADGKETGDRFAYLTKITSVPLTDGRIWSPGYVNINNGSIYDSASFIHTKKIYMPKGTKISCDTGYQFNYGAWDIDTGDFAGGSTLSAVERTINIDRNIIISLATNPATIITSVNDIIQHVHFNWAITDKLDYVDKTANKISVFNKNNVNFAGAPYGIYYEGQGTHNKGFSGSSTSAEVISAFDDLMNDYGSNYMTKTSLGLSSDGQNYLCEYTLTPKVASDRAKQKQPVILITSAQHGFEKASVYGLYYFVRDLLQHWTNNPVLDYIRNHVVLKIIPICNPYGFDNDSYLNANGVNINRNYDCSGFPVDPSAQPGDTTYGGAQPFDQPETQYIRDWILDNTNAFLYIDFHANGRNAIDSWRNVNWHSLCLLGDEYYLKLWDASSYHIENITAHFVHDYQLNIGSSVCGRITGGFTGELPGSYPSADVWVTNQGIMGMTFEGFNGFVDMATFTADVQKANCELIGNYINAVLCTYGMYQ